MPIATRSKDTTPVVRAGITTEIHVLGLAVQDRSFGACTEQVHARTRTQHGRRRLATSRDYDARMDVDLEQALVLAEAGDGCPRHACRAVLREIARLLRAAQAEDAREDGEIAEADAHVAACAGHIQAAHDETRAIGGLVELALYGRSR